MSPLNAAPGETKVEDVDPTQLIAEGRYMEFVVQLRRGAERGARIAALRPNWDDLVPALLLFREALRDCLLAPADDPLAPLELLPAWPNSTFAKEGQSRASNHLDPDHTLVEEQLRSYVGAVSDHLWGLAATMSANPPVRPAFVIGRVLLDASAHLYYLCDPSIPAAARASRAANIRLSALREELQDFADGEEGAGRVQEEIDAIVAAAVEDGFVTIRVRRGAPQLCLDPRLPSTGQLAGDLLGSLGPDAWRTLSSTVHAQDRPVLELSTGRGFVATTVQGRSQAALHLGASVVMCTEAMGRVTALRGLDPTLVDHAANNLNTLWQAAAGLNDAQYAAVVDGEMHEAAPPAATEQSE